MTPKERRDAQIELIDMAITLELWFEDDLHRPDTRRLHRAKLLRDIAAELNHVPEHP